MRTRTHARTRACVRVRARTRGRRERSVYRLRSVTSRAHAEEIKDFLPGSLVRDRIVLVVLETFIEEGENGRAPRAPKNSRTRSASLAFVRHISFAYSPAWMSLAPLAKLGYPDRIGTWRLRTCKRQTGLCQYTARRSLWIDIEHVRIGEKYQHG